MSLSYLRLPPSVIAELYKSTLIDLPDRPGPANFVSVQSRPLPPVSTFLGQNLKNILLYVDYPEEEFIPASELKFLTSMLGACGLELKHIALINLARQFVTVDELLVSLAPKYLLVFGGNAGTPAGIRDIPELVIATLQNFSVLKAPSLEKLNKNDKEGKLLKSRLWVNLKQLFNVA
jgi:hypothetical protein